MITRAVVQRSHSILADLSFAALLAALLYGLVRVAKHWEAPLQPHVDISLSLWALPGYTLYSLLRGFAAYGLSLIFAISYGYIAAYRRGAERVLLPLLDVLQSIPVLGFLPGVVLALVALFPKSNIGLELASILMIFTGQAWNMAFSFYQSLRTIPTELREAASLYNFNWWQRFRRLEFPSASVGLAWNSMMAMAGGWFFLMICEAFTLGEHDFRLPGLGAYMSVAIAKQELKAIIAGIVAMVIMIVCVDTLLWRPVLIWAQKFRLEDTASSERQESMVLNWLKRSWLAQEAMAKLVHPVSEWLSSKAALQSEPRSSSADTRHISRLLRFLIHVSALALIAVVLFGALRLVFLISQLHFQEWARVLASTLYTLARVTLAVVLGTLWTVPVGIWIGRSDKRCGRLQPIVQAAASFPAPMLYPLIVIALHWLHWPFGIISTVLMLVGTQWYILFNVIAGASSVPVDLREAALAYQFSPRQCWWMLWWPAVFPYLITGWITAAGGAWNASIVAEYVSMGGQILFAPGLGSLISLSALQARYNLLAASVLTMSVVVILINRCLWKPLYRFANARYAF